MRNNIDYAKYNRDDILKLLNNSKNEIEFLTKLGYNLNYITHKGSINKIICRIRVKYDIKHKFRRKDKKYDIIEKMCPICETVFTTKNNKDEKTTCSYSCSNVYFRSGVNNTYATKGNNYRTLCFMYHKKECIICKENKIVEVHHYDENNDNNSIDNLIPLCSTHHKYWHSKYRSLILESVKNYRDNFISTCRLTG